MHISSDRDLDNMHIERHRLFSSHRLEGGGRSGTLGGIFPLLFWLANEL